MKISCIVLTTVVCATTFSITTFAQSGWTVLNSGSSNDLYGVHFINADSGYTVGASATVLRTTNAGLGWQNVSPAGTTVDLNDVYAFNEPADRVVVVGDGGMILLTTDGGIHWASISSGVSDNLLSVSFFGGTGICGGGSQTILTSTDSGGSWNIAQSGFFGGGFWGTCMLSPQVGMVGGENSIFQPLSGRTTDSGNNWSFSPFYLNNNEGRAYGIDFTDLLRGYVAAGVWDGRGAIARTTDGGASWTTLFYPGILYSINFPISATGLVGFAAGDSGRVMKTTDAGNSWRQQASGTTATLRGVHFLDFMDGYAVGGAGLILKTTTGGEPSAGVEPESPGQFARSFSLQQNYPNPFNPTTVISFTLPRSSYVTLNVFTMLGKKIATVLHDMRSAGRHSFQWDGSGSPSGVYFYRLEADGFVQIRNMVLLR